MTKKRKGNILGLLILSSLVLIVALGLNQFALTGEIWIPEYASIWCGVCDIGQQQELYSYDGSETEYKLFTCKDGYVPKGCSFEIEPKSELGESALYICPLSVNENTVRQELENELKLFDSGAEIQGCTLYSENNKNLRTDIQNNFQIDSGQYLFLGSDVRISAKQTYEPYCLRTLERGQLSSKSDCSINYLSSQVNDVPDLRFDVLPFGRENHIEHVVIGYTGTINSVNVVGNKFIRLGLTNNIESCDLAKDKSGRTYVDLTTCRTDNTFECVPSLPPRGYICPNGQLQEIKEDAECQGTGVIGYRVVDQDSCELICSNGKQSIGQCTEIISYEQGKLDITPQTPVPEQDNLLLYIIIGGVVLVLMVIIATRPKSQGGLI